MNNQKEKLKISYYNTTELYSLPTQEDVNQRNSEDVEPELDNKNLIDDHK